MSPKSKRKKPSPRTKKRAPLTRRERRGVGVGAGATAIAAAVPGWKPAEAPPEPLPRATRKDSRQSPPGPLSTVRKVTSTVFPQWARTTLAVFIWIICIPLYVSVVAPYSAYIATTVMGLSLAVFSGLAPHLWKSRTPPWRTVFWTFVGSVAVAMPLLTSGTGRFAVVAATIVGFCIVLLRAGQNGRRLIGLIRDWRALR